jgi:hypothetical protein
MVNHIIVEVGLAKKAKQLLGHIAQLDTSARLSRWGKKLSGDILSATIRKSGNVQVFSALYPKESLKQIIKSFEIS